MVWAEAVEATANKIGRDLVSWIVPQQSRDREGAGARAGAVQLKRSAPRVITSQNMSDLDPGIKGKLAVVTGGASGIGFAAARLLAAHAARVYIFDLEHAKPYDAARQIGAHA